MLTLTTAGSPRFKTPPRPLGGSISSKARLGHSAPWRGGGPLESRAAGRTEGTAPAGSLRAEGAYLLQGPGPWTTEGGQKGDAKPAGHTSKQQQEVSVLIKHTITARTTLTRRSSVQFKGFWGTGRNAN